MPQDTSSEVMIGYIKIRFKSAFQCGKPRETAPKGGKLREKWRSNLAGKKWGQLKCVLSCSRVFTASIYAHKRKSK